jgi:ATP-dependent protease ClpP protease subunit
MWPQVLGGIMRRVISVLLAIVALSLFGHRVSAEVFIEDCTLKKPLGQFVAGSKIRIDLPHASGSLDILTWLEEHCHLEVFESPSFSFHINGPVDSHMEGSVKNIHDSFGRSMRFSWMKQNHMSISFSLHSEGGDLERAIRIGRMLRDINASITIRTGKSCLSACVLVLAGGVKREVFGTVGVHRPYFASLDRRTLPQEVAREIARIDALITNFLREMNLPIGLLDAMKAVSASEIRVLSGDALQTFGLNAPDPVFDELETARDAWLHGTDSAELRRRRVIAKQCVPRVNNFACSDAVMFGLSEREFQRRENRLQEICNAPPLETLRGHENSRFLEHEMENWLKCVREIMLGLR